MTMNDLVFNNNLLKNISHVYVRKLWLEFSQNIFCFRVDPPFT